jgi:hypothetical protein
MGTFILTVLAMLFGLSLVIGAIGNTEWFARTALGRSGGAFMTEGQRASTVQNVGHSAPWRLVMGALGAFLIVAGLFRLVHG